MAERRKVAPEYWPPKSRFWWVLAGFVMGAVGLLLLVGYLTHQQEQVRAGVNDPPNSAAQWVLRPIHVSIVSGVWDVPASGWRKWNFQVPSGARNYRLTGHYDARGGMGNDIEVVVATDDEWENWINGHPAHLFFAPGKLTTGSINVGALLPGNYTLGFNNKFSWLTPKSISVEVGADYQVLGFPQ